MKKILSIILCTLVICSILAGCGNKADTVQMTILVLEHNEDENCKAENGNITYKENPDAFTNILSKYEFNVEKGIDGFSAVKNALEENNINYEGNDEDGYFLSIDGFDWMVHGPNSGWLFEINDEPYDNFIKAFSIEEDCKIVFYYTDDYTLEGSM